MENKKIRTEGGELGTKITPCTLLEALNRRDIKKKE